MSRKLHQHETTGNRLNTFVKTFKQLSKDEFFKMSKKERKLYNRIATMHGLTIYKRNEEEITTASKS
jgi:hypothetical protein